MIITTKSGEKREIKQGAPLTDIEIASLTITPEDLESEEYPKYNELLEYINFILLSKMTSGKNIVKGYLKLAESYSKMIKMDTNSEQFVSTITDMAACIDKMLKQVSNLNIH